MVLLLWWPGGLVVWSLVVVLLLMVRMVMARMAMVRLVGRLGCLVWVLCLGCFRRGVRARLLGRLGVWLGLCVAIRVLVLWMWGGRCCRVLCLRIVRWLLVMVVRVCLRDSICLPRVGLGVALCVVVGLLLLVVAWFSCFRGRGRSGRGWRPSCLIAVRCLRGGCGSVIGRLGSLLGFRLRMCCVVWGVRRRLSGLRLCSLLCLR